MKRDTPIGYTILTVDDDTGLERFACADVYDTAMDAWDACDDFAARNGGGLFLVTPVFDVDYVE